MERPEHKGTALDSCAALRSMLEVVGKIGVFRKLDRAQAFAHKAAPDLSERGKSPCVLRADCHDGRLFLVVADDQVPTVSQSCNVSLHEVCAGGTHYLPLDIDIALDETDGADVPLFEQLERTIDVWPQELVAAFAEWARIPPQFSAGVASAGVRRGETTKISVHITTSYVVDSPATARDTAAKFSASVQKNPAVGSALKLAARKVDLALYKQRYSVRIGTTPKAKSIDGRELRAVEGSIHTHFFPSMNPGAFVGAALMTVPMLLPRAFSRVSALCHEQQ